MHRVFFGVLWSQNEKLLTSNFRYIPYLKFNVNVLRRYFYAIITTFVTFHRKRSTLQNDLTSKFRHFCAWTLTSIVLLSTPFPIVTSHLWWSMGNRHQDLYVKVVVELWCCLKVPVKNLFLLGQTHFSYPFCLISGHFKLYDLKFNRLIDFPMNGVICKLTSKLRIPIHVPDLILTWRFKYVEDPMEDFYLTAIQKRI